MSLKICTLLTVLTPVAALAGCASQVDSTHQGTPLAKVSGAVRNTRTTPVSAGADVVVVWVNSSGTPDIAVADSVEVEGSFPAQFSLSIYSPPAPGLLNDWEGVKVGVALIVAGVPGTDYSDDNAAEAGMLGMEVDHLLVYLPQAVPAGSAASIILHGTPGPGFHLYGVHKLTSAEAATRTACIDGLNDPTLQDIYTTCGGQASFDDFVPLPADLATPLDIEMVDDPSTIDVPNWT